MKVKGENRLDLEAYLPHNERVRMRILWVYDMAMIWIYTCLVPGLRLDLGLSLIPIEYAREVWKYGLLQMAVVPLVSYTGHPYAIMWGVSGVREVLQAVLACLAAALAQSVGIFMFEVRMPKSYYILWSVLIILVTMSGHASFQVLQETIDRINRFPGKNRSARVMIIGAGQAGTLILKEMKTSEKFRGYPVCMVDDDKDKLGHVIDRVSITGNREDIGKLARDKAIDEIYVATPTASPEDIGGILKICQETGCQVEMLPGVYQLINGEVMILRFRKVEIEDLLGREPVRTNLDEVMGYVKGRVVLVTGGGGSIGSKPCRQLVRHQVKQSVIFNIYGNNTYEIQQELRHTHPQLDLVVLTGSVRNTNRLEGLFRTYRPDIVYHTIAHEHVPLMEDGPYEAAKDNVMRTYKVTRAAIKYGVRRFILISTDKAVDPTNIMGTSKHLCKMIIQMNNQKSRIEFVAVRFENVLGSNGSVIPLFKQRIENSGPVTVAHKDIIRYFVTIPEVVNLVIQAGAYAKDGEIFVPNTGKPVKILNMAENLIRLSGYEPYKNIDVYSTGLRPSEKLYEGLLMDEGGLQKTENERILIGTPIQMDYKRFEKALNRLGEAAQNRTGNIRRVVYSLVPEYHYRGSDTGIAASEAAAGLEPGVAVSNADRPFVHRRIAMYNMGGK